MSDSPDEHEDPAVKFARESEERQRRVQLALRKARQFQERADEILDDNPEGALQLEVRGLREGLNAVLISLQIE